MTDHVLAMTFWPVWVAHTATCGAALATAWLIDTVRTTR